MPIPDNLKAYEKPITQILSWMPDWLKAEDFDLRAYAERPTEVFMPYHGNTPILTAGIFHGAQQGALQLLFWMLQAGLVERRIVAGATEWRATP